MWGLGVFGVGFSGLRILGGFETRMMMMMSGRGTVSESYDTLPYFFKSALIPTI